MPIRGYSRPQLLISQQLARLVDPTARSLNAFVFGPQFDLFRYTNAAERAAMNGVLFTENHSSDPSLRQLVPYEGLKANHIVDKDFVQLWAEKLEAQLWAASSPAGGDVSQGAAAKPYVFKIPGLDQPTKIRVVRRGARITLQVDTSAYSSSGKLATKSIDYGGSGYPASTSFDVNVPSQGSGAGAVARLTTNSAGVVTSVAVVSPGSGYAGDVTFDAPSADVGANVGVDDATLITELYGRTVKPGDVLYATYGGTTVRRTVKSVEKEVVAAHFGVDAGKADKKMAGSSLNPIQSVSASFTPTVYPSGWTLALDSASTAADWSGLEEGSKYGDKYGERYILTVTQGGDVDARLRIRSASGVFSAENITPTAVLTDGGGASSTGVDYWTVNHAALGGLILRITPSAEGTPFKLGDTFEFIVIGKYNPLNVSQTGQITAITISAGGSGYTDGVYALTISAPPAGGTQATGTARVVSGAVTQTIITNPGAGYLAAPNIQLPGGAGSPVAANTAYLVPTVSAPENSRDIAVVQSGVYTGTSDTRYLVTVVEGVKNASDIAQPYTGAVLRVTDANGIDSLAEYTITHGVDYNLGTLGLQFIVPNKAIPAAATFGTPVLSGTAIVYVPVTSGGAGYTGNVALTVTGGSGTGAVLEGVVANGKIVGVKITSGGNYTVAPTVAAPAPVTYQKGLRKGDVFYVDVVAKKAAGPSSVIVLNGQASDTASWTDVDVDLNLFDIDLRVLFSGQIMPKGNDAPNLDIVVGDRAQGGILVRKDLSYQVTDRDSNLWVPFKTPPGGLTNAGRLFAHWRGLVPATSADRIRSYPDNTSVITEFGVDDKDNPVSFGACRALEAAQGKAVWAGRIATNDAAGFTKILTQAERVDGAVYLAPMTSDYAVQKLVENHCVKVSAEDWRLWRRAYVATQNPGTFSVMDLDSNNVPFSGYVLNNGTGNLRVVCANADFITRGIRPGDLLRTSYRFNEWEEQEFDTYEVANVLENDELLLVTGPNSPINPSVKFEIWRPDTGLTQAEFIGARSANFADRRIVNVWADSPYKLDENDEIQNLPLYYTAAEVAGLRSALFPQQGLTYTEIEKTITAAPLMFTKYSQEELNVAASNGTFVITQDMEGGPVYIRHQLTTDSNNGSLYYEDSVGASLDDISYGLKDIYQPYIGKRNATPETVEELLTKTRDFLDRRKANPAGFASVGPQIVNYSDLKIAINPTFKDRIDIDVTLEFPLPLNTLKVTLHATTISDATLAALTQTQTVNA